MSRPAEPETRSEEAFDFVSTRIRKTGKPPSRAELAEHLGVSVSRVTAILNNLAKEGKIELDSRVSWLTLPGYALRPKKG